MSVAYDGDGNRVSETVGGVTTNYLVDTVNPTGYVQVADELQAGAVSRTYSYGLERISENQTISGAATTSFYGYDGHGSVRQLTNSTGAVTDSYDYDAFGNLISSTGSTPNNYLFAGEQFDPALGLYYNRARYLNTTTGRFWSMDTVEGSDWEPASLHKYLYAKADPVDHVDPSGNQIDDVMIGIAIDFSLNAMSVPTISLGRTQNQLRYSTVLNDPTHHTWEIAWKLAGRTLRGGYIVQHIKINAWKMRNYEYWEAWQVLMLSDTPYTSAGLGYDDMFRGPTGTAIQAEARFYDGLTLPASFVYGFTNPDTAPAGGLLATPMDPNLPTTFATQPVDRLWFAP